MQKNLLKVSNEILQFGSEFYPVRNIAHIGKYEVKKKPIISIRIMAITIFLSLVFIKSFSPIILLIALLIITFGIVERIKRNNYAFVLQTNAGSTQLFSSSSEVFVDKVILAIVEVINNKDKQKTVTINVKTKEISIGQVGVIGDNASINNSTQTYNQH